MSNQKGKQNMKTLFQCEHCDFRLLDAGQMRQHEIDCKMATDLEPVLVKGDGWQPPGLVHYLQWTAGDKLELVTRLRAYFESKEAPDLYYIWSVERGAWWLHNKCGYTNDIAQAGKYERKEAIMLCQEANVINVNEHMVPVPPDLWRLVDTR
jgi:hypothetical protein